MKNRNPVARRQLGSTPLIALCLLLAACGSPTGPTPPALPGTPLGLSISTDGNGNSTLSWSSVSEADSYKVYHSSDGIAAYSEVSSTTGISYLLPFYGWYKVSAVNEAGEGAKSAGVERAVPAAPSGKAATPDFSVAAGTYDETQSVAITCATGGSTIYYTTDGSTPVVGTSAVYSAAISVDPGDTRTITAVAAAAGYSNSDAAVGTFHVRTWEVVGSAGFSGGEVFEPSIDLGPDGSPYVGYRDGSVVNKATVMRFNGSSWAALGGTGVSAAGAYDTSLVVDSQGAVYLSYYDASVSAKVTVRKYSAGAWTTLGGAGISGGEALFPSLAVHESGSTRIPYIAYQDGATDPPAKATVLKYSGASWEAVGTAGFSPGTIEGTSLAIGSDGALYLAFKDGSTATRGSSVMKWGGASWSLVGTSGFSSGEITSISLAFDGGGAPVVAFSGGSANPTLRATVMRWDGADWNIVGGSPVSSGAADFVSLTVAADGALFVVFKDAGTIPAGKATAVEYDGLSWKTLGTPGFSAGVANGLKTAIDSVGDLYVVFRDGNTVPADKATVMAWR